MGVVLDTSVLIAAVTASELLHGVERARTADIQGRRSRYVECVIDKLSVAVFGLPEARAHAGLWAQLSAQGRSIGPYYLLVAATSLSLGFSLATLNQKEFKRVPGLTLFTVSV